MKVGTSEFVLALLILLVRVDGIRVDGLMPLIMTTAERNQPFLIGDVSLHDIVLESSKIESLSSKNVPPNLSGHSCHEIFRKVEKFLVGSSLNEETNTLATEAFQNKNSSLQIKVIFCKKNQSNNKGFCPVEDAIISVSISHENRVLPSIDPSLISLRNMGKEVFVKLKYRVLSMKKHLPLKVNVRNSCDVCHATTDQIVKDLINHDQQIEIMKWLFDICAVFERHVDQCKRFVFEYGPLFLANLHKFLTSEDVCQLIRMCAEPTFPNKNTDFSYLRSIEH